MRFTAIDVETANESIASICQIGVATFQNGEIISQWSSYVNPKTHFSWMNIDIHGINEKKVSGAPTIEDLSERIIASAQNSVIATYTHFDRSALNQALPGKMDNITWLDVAKVVRRQWEQFSYKGYGLARVAEFLSIDNSRHHDALSDAIVAGTIFAKAMTASGKNVAWWLKRTAQPISPTNFTSVSRCGNPEGHLYGEVIVFTGSLTITRQEAANIAANAGCEVKDSVSKKTTLLVVGDQDIQKLAGKEKSSKHLKAEEIIKTGGNIRILAESDFLTIANDV